MKKQKQPILLILIILAVPLTLMSSLLINTVQLPSSLKQYAWPLLICLALLLIAISVWQIFLDRDAEQNSRVLGRKNRQHLLGKVRSFWIKGVLDQSLHGAALIALELLEQPDAVASLWRLALQLQDQPASLLPSDTRILQVYDEANSELLLLGEPGSGKTTLLLELARDLLERAKDDEMHPIPVVLNLSSWAVKRQPLTRWLIEELNSKYQVPYQLGQLWVEGDEILPLLDGLDEVASDFRPACVESINTYRRQHGLVPMVVCCRSNEYLDQPVRVQLQTAVVVQPLTADQINTYLKCAGEKLELVRLALHDDLVLQELVTTPLMLSILALTYQGKSAESLKSSDSIDTQRQTIFRDYVQRMLERRRADTHFEQQKATHWLAWLAKQMKLHNQTELYIERIQLNWLPESFFYQLLPSIIIGLIYGLGVTLVYGVYFGFFLRPNLLRGLVCGSLLGLLNWFIYVLLNGYIFEMSSNTNTKKRSEKVVILSWIRRDALIKFLENRLVYGLIFGLLNGILVAWLGVLSNFFEGLSGAIVYGLINVVLAVITYGLLGKLDTKIQPVEIVSWLWTSFGRNLIRSLANGLLVGLIYGLSLGLLYNTLFFQLTIGLSLGLVLGLLLALTNGLSHEMLNEQLIVRPNQGIRYSLRNSVFTGFAGFVISGLGFGLAHGLSTGFYDGLVFGLSLGLTTGLIAWMRSGGTACLLHAFLRVCLWLADFAPLNYPRFLDYAVGHILLRRVGGGYIFVHRQLLDYFASLK